MIEKKEPVGYLVDSRTGEITNELYEGDRHRIIRKKQIDYSSKNEDTIEEDKMYEFGQDTKFSMLSSFSAKQLADENLTSAQYRVMLLMISNTNYKSGLIAFGNNKPMTSEWITKALKINKKTTDSCLRVLRDKGIINQSTTNNKTKYFFNPYIQYRGRWINKTLYEMFKNTKWAKQNK